MKESEYLAQMLYFSESEGQLLAITTLPYKRAAYSYRKCMEQFGTAFAGSELEKAFLEYLEPSAKEVREMLTVYGKVSHLYRMNESNVKAKIRGAAKREGLTVKHSTIPLGQAFGWVEAEVVTKLTVKVKGRAVV